MVNYSYFDSIKDTLMSNDPKLRLGNYSRILSLYRQQCEQMSKLMPEYKRVGAKEMIRDHAWAMRILFLAEEDYKNLLEGNDE
jgi:hypothetical protein